MATKKKTPKTPVQLDFFKTALKNAGNEHARLLGDYDDDVTFHDTGSYSLNGLLSGSIYGGYPSDKISAFAGEESVGKTFIVLSCALEFQKKYPDTYILYYESEGAASKEMLVDRGFNEDKFVIVPVATVEQFRTHASKMLTFVEEQRKENKDFHLLVILDSLGNLSTNKETSDIEDGEDKRDMTRSGLVKGTFRVLSLRAQALHIPFLITNHVYAVIGSMYPQKEQSGGSGLKYNASNIVFFTKAKVKEGTDVIGNIVTATLKKGRFTKENKKVQTRITYKEGLNRYYGLMELGALGGLFTKISNKWKLPDGTMVFEKAIYKNPEKYFTKEILDQIDIIVGKEFKYGSDSEIQCMDSE